MTTFPYFDPPAQLTQENPSGVRYDYNHGLRVQLPGVTGGCRTYHVTFRDASSGNVVFESDVKSGSIVESKKKYYVDWAWSVVDDEGEVIAETTHLSLFGRDVLVSFPVDTLGDPIAWFSAMEDFHFQHQCNLHVCMSQRMIDIFEKQYPEFEFVTIEEVDALEPLATYSIGMFDDLNYLPGDYHSMNLAEIATSILGLSGVVWEPPKVDLSAPPVITEPYVCISAMSSAQCKFWNNPSGWRLVVEYLKKRGFRVLCIDGSPEAGYGSVWNHIPYGAEDFTGFRPLQERIDLLHHAACFVGLPSGLSWLAWCSQTPVVMISGISEHFAEFPCFRVTNKMVCHGCWNDSRYRFDCDDFLWCPRFQNLDDKFECTKMITAKMVIDQLERIL